MVIKKKFEEIQRGDTIVLNEMILLCTWGRK